ncbi:hypothetical protein BDZ97DRAFT_2047164 [Flammula alnicola]|nr:hypothetical protein BDZ97DRAFT_2047164 [Flammula alnicola]
MLSSLETPRPLPPAKARKASAMHKASSTPPPAYGSTFTFPARHQLRQDILASPMGTTFQMVGWNEITDPVRPLEASSDDLGWMNEQSREELKDLLLKADEIIKERENELGLTSAMCHGLYQNNVALKSKHQALIARLPVSPTRSTSSPGNLYHHARTSSRDDNISLTSSSSDSVLGLIKSPREARPSLFKGHTRKVSIATADISLLADQNAELLDKLEKLEVEATSADHAGRRELKRLEKEIASLREALEKTQARSEELEEKVQGAVVGEAWRRKKEREAKFRAMRTLGRDGGHQNGDDDNKEEEVRNFAPEGSKFGGPSEAFSFFPTAQSPDPNRRGLGSSTASSVEADLNLLGSSNSLHLPEHVLISQLLVKVQELEETNARILQQQSDTAVQLSAMQRDTAHMSRVYECLSDPNSVEIELAEDAMNDMDDKKDEEDDKAGAASRHTIRFMSLKRTIEKEMKSVMGLFDVEQVAEEDNPEDQEKREENSASTGSLYDDEIRVRLSLSSSPWTEGHDRSTWSSVGSHASSPTSRLSPLHFFSPPSHAHSHVEPELSPLGARATLQTELDRELGAGAGGTTVLNHNHHLRTSSLYDLSQISVPPSPSPTSRTASRRASDELDYEAGTNASRTPGLFVPPDTNSLQLSIEPPTPQKQQRRGTGTEAGDEEFGTTTPTGASSTTPKSPRIKLISDTLRSRGNRWADRRLRPRRERSRSQSREDHRASGSGSTAHSTQRAAAAASSAKAGYASASSATDAVGIPRRLLCAVDIMIDGFDGAQPRGTNVDVDSGSMLAPSFEPDEDSSYNNNANTSMQLRADLSPKKQDAAEDVHPGFLFQAWLWIQFAIVVFVFLYAMAKRGPTVVLSEENKRAVARRR